MTEKVNSNSSIKICIALAVMNFIGLVLTLMFNDSIVMDELEHLRASYFVSLGKMPYRDFFEHHHPLIWLMFAPIISVLPNSNIITLYTAKSLAFAFSGGSIAVLYLLAKRFLGGVLSALLTLAFFFVYFSTWYTFSLFKPDTFMRLFYLLGLYFFLAFYQTKETKKLVLCGLFFCISFLFLQTVAFSILPLILPVLWLLYKKEMRIQQLLQATILPVVLILGVMGFFYITGTLERYYELNVVYNRYLFEVFHSRTPRVLHLFSVIPVMAFVAMLLIYKCKKANFYFNTIVMLFVAESIQRIIFPVVYPHYLILLHIFSALIIGFALQYCNKPLVLKFIFGALFINLFSNYAYISITNNKSTKEILLEYDKHPNATQVNFNVTLFSIFAPDLSYYWFYPDFEYMDNVMFNHFPDYDINQIINENKVEYVAYNPQIKPYFNWGSAGLKYKPTKDLLAKHTLDTSILQNYETVNYNLYRRKK